MSDIRRFNQYVYGVNSRVQSKLGNAALLVAMILAATITAEAALLEEVVVQAQKRSESAQDVPIAVSALGSEDIEKYGVVDVYDLRGAVPGLEVRRATAFGNPTFTIRGVGATNFDTISGSVVATYIDDIPQVSSGQLNFTTFDLANIEVLKGPQGTLFGAGTTAGVVHFKSNRPTDDFEAYAKAGAGNYGAYELEGAISGPLTDRLSGRLSLRTETFDGYYYNIATNDDAGGQDAYQLRAQLLRQTDSASVLLGVNYSKSESEAILYQLVPLLADDGTGTAVTCPVIQAAIDRGRLTEGDVQLANRNCVSIFGETNTGNGVEDPFRSNSQSVYGNDSPVDLETFGFNLRADIDVGENTFTSITGVSQTEHGGVDPEGTLGRLGTSDVLWLTDVSMLSQEFQLASGGSSDNTWIIGASFVAHKIENDLRSQLNFPSFGAEGATFIDETPAETLAGSVSYAAPQEQDTREAGIFGQADWYLSDSLTAVTGVRGSWYRKEGTVEAVGIFASVDTVLEETGLSFNLGLNYTPSDDVLVYGKVSQGIRSGSHAGGFIFSADAAPGAKQERLLSYETGVKSMFFNGSLQVNGAAFYYDYNDIQSLSQRLVGTTFVQRYTNIGDAEVKGLELDVVWAPIAELLFKLGATLLDTEVTRSDDQIAIDFKGNNLANSPDLQASFLSRYTTQIMDGFELSVQYDANFTDDQFRNVDNSALDFDESTFKHNAVVTLTSPDGTWDVSAYGRNLSDELDFTWQFSFGGVQRRSYNEPRTYGISATYRW